MERGRILVAALTVLLASCGGGGGSSTPAAPPGNTYVLNGLPTSLAFAGGGFTGSVSLPAGNPPLGDTITLIAQTAPYPESPAAQLTGARTAAAATHLVLVYIGVTFGFDTPAYGQPGFTFVPPPGVDLAGGPFFIAYFDPLSPTWTYGFMGPGVVSNGTLSFSGPPTASTFKAGRRYIYALYQDAPSPLLASPGSLGLAGSGASFARSFDVTESAYTGAITQTNTCSGIATFAPASGSGPSLHVTATGVAAGTCAVTYRDTAGQSATVTISVTIGSVTVD